MFQNRFETPKIQGNFIQTSQALSSYPNLKEYEQRIEKLKKEKLGIEEFYKNQLESLREDKHSLQNFFESKLKEFEMMKKLDKEELECQRKLCQELEREILRLKGHFSKSENLTKNSETESKLLNERSGLLIENTRLRNKIKEMENDLSILGELQTNAETLVNTNLELNKELESLRRSQYSVPKDFSATVKASSILVEQNIEAFFQKEISILENRIVEEVEESKKWRTLYYESQQMMEELKEKQRNFQISNEREQLLVEKEKYQEEVLLDFIDKEDNLRKEISRLNETISGQKKTILDLENLNAEKSQKLKECQALSLEELAGKLSQSLLLNEELKSRISVLEAKLHSNDIQVFDFRELEARCDMLSYRNAKLEKEITRLQTNSSAVPIFEEKQNIRKSFSAGKTIAKNRQASLESPLAVSSVDKNKEFDNFRLKKKYNELFRENKRLNRTLLDEQKYSNNLQEKISKFSKSKF